MQVGISEIVLPQISLDDFFQQSAAAGYDIVELCVGGDFPLQLDNQEKMIPKVRELSEQYRLPVVSLAVEFIWNGFLFSPLEMKRFLDDVGSESIGFYFDPGNMAVFQYPHHWARILGKYIKMVHMKDWRGDALCGDWPALFEGDVDFGRIMKELRAAGYCDAFISEIEPAVDPIQDTADKIRKIIQA